GNPSAARQVEGLQKLHDYRFASDDHGEERQCPKANHDLEDAIEQQGPRGAIGEPTTPKASDGESEKEDREDGTDGVGRRAEEEHELTGPDDLVEQSARSRDQEEQKYDD